MAIKENSQDYDVSSKGGIIMDMGIIQIQI